MQREILRYDRKEGKLTLKFHELSDSFLVTDMWQSVSCKAPTIPSNRSSIGTSTK
jgi:hypothetical protein